MTTYVQAPRGDIYDVKKAIATALTPDRLTTALLAALSAKLGDQTPPSLANLMVLEYERLVALQYPLLELVAYSTAYEGNESMVKMGRHRVGCRWSTLEATEELATRAIELLCRATVDILWSEADGLMAGLLADAGLNAGPVTIVEEDYSPLLPNQNGVFMKSGVVILEVTTYRD